VEFESEDHRIVYAELKTQVEKGQYSIKALKSALPKYAALVDDISTDQPFDGDLTDEIDRLSLHRLADPEASKAAARAGTSAGAGSFHTLGPDPQTASGDQQSDSKLHLITGRDIISMNIPEQKDLVKHLFRENSVNFLAGEEGCGKSLLMMNLAISVAVEAKKYLNWDIEKSGKVLYLNNELSSADFIHRAKRMFSRLPVPGDLSNLVVSNETLPLDECWDELKDICEKEKPCLIILDCLYFAHTEDENDSSRMKDLMRRFLYLRDEFSLCLIIVHHTKKGTRSQKLHSDQIRGAGVFGAAADSVLMLRRSQTDDGKRIIKPTKLRHSSDDNRKARLLSLDPEHLWFRDEGEANESEHIDQDDRPKAREVIDFRRIYKGIEEMTRKEIIQACRDSGYSEATIDRAINTAIRQGILAKEQRGIFQLVKP
jgi:KaiC/GvpD/RAD55 family RecA-like ATPase